MPSFRGVALIGGTERQVEVSGNPAGRTVVRVDGVPMYDEKPFVARDSVRFDVGGQTVTLTWRQPSLSRLECDISSGGITATLSGVASSGELVAPLDPAARRRSESRSLGLIALAAGLGLCWWNYDSLQRGHYQPKYLYAVPTLVILGLLGAIVPSEMIRERGRTAQLLIVLGSLLAMLGLGFLFSRWFLETFSPR